MWNVHVIVGAVSTDTHALWLALRWSKHNIAAQLSSAYAKKQNERRQQFLKEISGIQFLARQGLAMRGHTDIEGNLHQLLLSQSHAYNDKQLWEWVNSGEYISHDIVNELMGLMANTIVKQIVTEVKSAGVYAIIADETQDITGKEQLVICLRWVDSSYMVQEDAIGLYQMDCTNADSITSAILDVLTRADLQMCQCRGQGYDGAATMSGCYTGVARRLLTIEPRAFYTHCAAHNLQLCLQDCAKQCPIVKQSHDLLQQLVSLIRNSPKRLALFRCIQSDYKMGKTALKPLCPTRWTVRTESIDSVMKNYENFARRIRCAV